MELTKEILECFQYKFGSPLYVFDEYAFIENYRHFNKCFKSIYPYYQLSYSYKTNYAPYVCRLVKSMGGYAEVVSDMELQIAQSIGYRSNEIIYNGPSKGPLSLEHVINEGILNIDSFDELKRICSFAKKHLDKQLNIGLRVNIDIGQDFISRFGIDDEMLKEAFSIVNNIDNITVSGIHCHVGRSRELDAWSRRVNKMIAIADDYFEDAPDYISLGSGMFGVMEPELASQFGEKIPTFEEYAEVVAAPFAKHYQTGKIPLLFTEPGTTLINKYVDFIAIVESIKRIKGQVFVVLNGSKHNLGEICEIKKLPIRIFRGGNTTQYIENAKFVGYTCLEHDVLYDGFSGNLAVGDYVVFDNVGGYSNVSKPPFIRPNCAMISSNGNLIKREETVKEIIETYE